MPRKYNAPPGFGSVNLDARPGSSPTSRAATRAHEQLVASPATQIAVAVSRAQKRYGMKKRGQRRAED